MVTLSQGITVLGAIFRTVRSLSLGSKSDPILGQDFDISVVNFLGFLEFRRHR